AYANRMTMRGNNKSKDLITVPISADEEETTPVYGALQLIVPKTRPPLEDHYHETECVLYNVARTLALAIKAHNEHEQMQQHNRRLQDTAMHYKRTAETDALTGVYTRRKLDEILATEKDNAAKNDQMFSMLMIDVDHFKKVNDTYGHHIGDIVLKEVGAILRREVRRQDTAARYGGEEFAVVLPGKDKDAAVPIAERIRIAIKEHDWATVTNHKEFAVTASIGVAAYDVANPHVERLADQQLYAAKHDGRNRVHF
ncbi:MAG: GGDEF domain-containing protein, partial [Nanoarchaeota archaeon]